MQISHLKQTRHSSHLCRYHIVFIPKWRKSWLLKYQFLLSRLIVERCKELGVVILELSTQDDHVHLFIEARPDINLAKFVGKLKSYLTKMLLEERPELMEQFPKRNLWARGYFIATCGVESEVIQNYILNQ